MYPGKPLVRRSELQAGNRFCAECRAGPREDYGIPLRGWKCQWTMSVTRHASEVETGWFWQPRCHR